LIKQGGLEVWVLEIIEFDSSPGIRKKAIELRVQFVYRGDRFNEH
jgi:hypothetical protein